MLAMDDLGAGAEIAHGGVVFDPLGSDYMEQPAAHLAEVRASAPVQSVFDRWMLFEYADCFAMLRDPTLSVDDLNSNLAETERGRQLEQIVGDRAESQGMLSTDPPDHTRLRRLVTKAFTPRTIDALRPRVQELVDERLDHLAAQGGGDLVGELAYPLPFEVISEMLGMPEADRAEVITWSAAMVKTLDPIISDEDVERAFTAQQAMRHHVTEVIAWKREHPAEDLLSALIQAEEAGDRLTTEELVAQVVLLYVAGHETTVNLIGTGALELLRHPEQAAGWAADPSLGSTAVDELLRWVSPVQMSRRIATTDLRFGDITIPERSFVLVMLASANRDPAQWGDTAETLDLGRANAGQHISFGSGAHYCLGASLAKLETDVALGSFLRRFPDAEVAGEHTWNGRLNLRGLDSLPVRVG